MELLETFEALLQMWRGIFPQQRSFERARRLAFGLLVCLRAHLTSNALCALGRQFQDWTADYRLHSRSPWDPHLLFDPIFDRVHPLLHPDCAPVFVAMDDTGVKKSGRKIPGVFTMRDPMSLPFHVNLIRGLRFVQASLLVFAVKPGPARALPVRFEPAPVPSKPKKTLQMMPKKSTTSRRKLSASAESASVFWLRFVARWINSPTLYPANSSLLWMAPIPTPPCLKISPIVLL